MFDNDGLEIEELPRDRPFNAYRCPASDKVKAIVADVTNQLQNYEEFHELRKRKRRKPA